MNDDERPIRPMGADNIGQFKVTETDNKIAASEDGSEIDISKKNNFASKI